MKKVWTTKEGKKILYSDLENSHLLNILRLIDKRAEELDGEVIDGGGVWDIDDMWYVEGDKEDWLKKFDYKGLLKELNKRGLALSSILK